MEGAIYIINCLGGEVAMHGVVRVKITTDRDIATRTVRVVARIGPGVTPVMVVDHEPDELVIVENPDSLPTMVRRRLENKYRRQ